MTNRRGNLVPVCAVVTTRRITRVPERTRVPAVPTGVLPHSDGSRWAHLVSVSTPFWNPPHGAAELVLNIEGAKTADTRRRRIEKHVGMLRDGRAR